MRRSLAFGVTPRPRTERAGERSHVALDGLPDALGNLREIDSVAQLIRRAPIELCHACGFDRAMVSLVEDAGFVTASVCIPADPELATRAQEFALDHLLPSCGDTLEVEMLRRRRPLLVTDAQDNPRVWKAFAELVSTTSYVAAPVLMGRRVVALLHADLRDSGLAADAVDLSLLAGFAEGFGFALRHALARAELDSLRKHLSALGAVQEAAVPGSLRSEPDLSAGAPSPSEPSAVAVMVEGDLRDLLTRREREVFRLMIKGASNAQIAAKLVVSNATVKSHVGAILHKMNAANRVEAVARYLTSFAGPGRSGPALPGAGTRLHALPE
jgi:LuxR family transcriptional regulator, regulator of acetate metabolism